MTLKLIQLDRQVPPSLTPRMPCATRKSKRTRTIMPMPTWIPSSAMLPLASFTLLHVKLMHRLRHFGQRGPRKTRKCDFLRPEAATEPAVTLPAHSSRELAPASEELSSRSCCFEAANPLEQIVGLVFSRKRTR